MVTLTVRTNLNLAFDHVNRTTLDRGSRILCVHTTGPGPEPPRIHPFRSGSVGRRDGAWSRHDADLALASHS
jgi:hypothetical protein